MGSGKVLVLLCFCFTYSTIISQNHILGKDSLELSFYPISGLENYHSENGCKITGSAWVDSLSVKINLTVKDDYLKLDKPYKNGDYVEVIFVVPELKDSENVYINRGSEQYLFNYTNDLNKFKKEWRNPLIVTDTKTRYSNIVDQYFKNAIKQSIDTSLYSQFKLKHIPFGETQFLIYPETLKVFNSNKEKMVENISSEYGDNATKIEKQVITNINIDSTSFTLSLICPIESFAYISKKMADEIRFMINFVMIDSTESHKVVYTTSSHYNKNTYSKYNKLFPPIKFTSKMLYDKILPTTFDSSFSPIFLNTEEGWKPYRKTINKIEFIASTANWTSPNLYISRFWPGVTERRKIILDSDTINIYSIPNPNSKDAAYDIDYVTENDSLILITDNLINVVRLNSGEFAYVISEEEYQFGDCRSAGPCGCCTYFDYYLLTKQDIKTRKSNKLLLCSVDYNNGLDGVTFYKDVDIGNISDEKQDVLFFNKFNNNTFSLSFSKKRVVTIKVDEEKWRLIFIKNW